MGTARPLLHSKPLFLSGMLATSGHMATAVRVVGKDLDVKAGREAAYAAHSMGWRSRRSS
jgi:hypothetical protein